MSQHPRLCRRVVSGLVAVAFVGSFHVPVEAVQEEAAKDRPLVTLSRPVGFGPDMGVPMLDPRLPRQDYLSLAELLADVWLLVKQGVPVPPGVTLSLDRPRPGGILIETERYQIIETMLTDNTATGDLRRIRRLSAIDKVTGETIHSEEMVPNQLLVKCHHNRLHSEAAELRAVSDEARAISATVKEEVADGTFLLESVREQRVEKAIAQEALNDRYQAHDEISYAEPNGVVRLMETANDPEFKNLWGLLNTGQSLPVSLPIDVPKGTPGVDIKATQAWDLWKGDRNILIGVIDTGTNYNIPDLAPNIWTNPGEIPGNKIDDDKNGFVDDVHGYDFVNEDGDPMDDHNHGSHVAGTIGAMGNNGIGIVGVMHKAKMVPIKFLSAAGRGSWDDAVKAIDYATKIGCALTSNSWGGGGGSQALKDAIARAGAKGSLFVAAAGNGSNDADTSPFYPAAYPLDNIISVAAIDATDRLASFSTFGKVSVDLGAPGVQVLSYDKAGGLKWWAGTSMATPHVSGVVGLIRSFNPQAPADFIRTALFTTVTPAQALNGKTVTGGRVNARGALELVTTGVYIILSPVTIPDDGFLSPGETVDLSLELKNIGTETAAGVTASLTASDPNVSILTPSLDYGELPRNVGVSRTARIAIGSSLVTPTNVTFTMTISDSASHSFIRTFASPIYSMGRISGHIKRGRFDTPIDGATVAYQGTITGTNPPVELTGEATTDSAGDYQLSLPRGTYTLIAKKSGLFDSAPRTVMLPPDQTVDFALGAPELEFSPPSFSIPVPVGQTASCTLSISNEQGTGDLTYQFQGTSDYVRLRSLTNEFDSGTGVAWDGSTLWISQVFPGSKFDLIPKTSNLIQVDPMTGATLKTLPVKYAACAPDKDRRKIYDMTWHEGYLWAIEYTLGVPGCYSGGEVWSVVKIDPQTGQLVKRFVQRKTTLTSEPEPAIAWKEGALFVLRTIDGIWYLVQMNPETGAIMKQGPALPPELQWGPGWGGINGGLSGEGGTLWAGRWVWTADRKNYRVQLLQLSVDSTLRLAVQTVYDLSSLYPPAPGGPSIYDVEWDGALLWLQVPIMHLSDLFSIGDLRPWLSLSLRSGSLPFGTTREITLTANASGMRIGTYQDTLRLVTNDPDELTTLIPVTMTVTPGGNRAPVAQSQAVTTSEDTAKAITLGASDPDGDALTYSLVSGPTRGILSGGSGASRTYTPTKDQHSSDSFTFKANDGKVDSNVATVSITINSVNDAPIAQDQAVTTNEDTAVAITLGASDVDGDALTYAIKSSPAHGSLTGSGASQTYTPAANYVGPDSFTFKANDGTVDSNVATVAITVEPLNDVPVLDPIGNKAVAEGSELAFTVHATDPDGDLVLYAADPLPGGAALDPVTGEFAWTPGFDQAGSYPNIEFVASDGRESVSEIITITVTNTNRPPTLAAMPDQTVAEGQELAFTMQGSDPDGDALTYAMIPLLEGSSLDPTTGAFAWTPDYDQAGVYPVECLVSDGKASASETMTITVTNTNRPPVLSPIGDKTGEEKQLLTFTLSGSDPDGESLTYTASALPAGATFTAATRTFSWTPAKGQAGTYPGVTFTVSDGALMDEEAITITVTPAPNNPPVFSPVSPKTVNEGQYLAFWVSATDADGDPLTLSASNLPRGAQFWLVNGSRKTLANTLARGYFTWAPDYTQGGSYSVRFTVTDGTATVTQDISITVVDKPQDRPPVANAGPDQSVLKNTKVTLNGAASTDPDGDPIWYYRWTQTAGPTVSLRNRWSIRPTFTPSLVGSYTFSLVVYTLVRDPTTGFWKWVLSGPDSVTVTVR